MAGFDFGFACLPEDAPCVEACMAAFKRRTL